MKINKKVYNTLPYGKDPFWQFVIFPTITIMRNLEKHDRYIVINTEWLFWSLVIIVK